jgi:tetratricopeptide (TPR) repeat protein
MRRRVSAGVALAVLAVLPLAEIGRAAAPPMPSGRLDPAQEKQLGELNSRLNRAVEAGQLREALILAREIAALRQRWQGSGHWQAVDARWQVEQGQRLARLTQEQQRRLGQSIGRVRAGERDYARGRYREAEKAFREALAINRKAVGEEHANTAESYNNIALCLKRQGKQDDALPLLQKALAIRRKVLGDEHPITAQSHNNLASCLNDLGKLDDAMRLYRKALAINRKARGEEHPDTARSYNNLGHCLRSQGKDADALPLYRKALAIWRTALGEDHPDTALSYTNVASCLDALGRHTDALPLAQKALAISRRVLAEEHPNTAAACNNLASCLDNLGRHADALPLHHKSLAIHRRVLGEDHSSTATSYRNLASCLQAQGKHAEALPLFRKALDIWRQVHTEEHARTAAGYNSVGVCLERQGKDTEALPLYEKALTIRRKVLREDHADHSESCNNLGCCLSNLGKRAQALPLYQKALEINRKVLGEDHPTTARSYNNVAFCLYAMGRYGEALPLARKALAIRRQRLGEEHPDTGESYTLLALFLSARRRYWEAIRCWQAALPGSDSGRLGSASSGFDRSLFRAEETPRLWLAVTFAHLKDPKRAWQYAEADLARGLLDDLSAFSGSRRSQQTSQDASAVWPLARIQKQVPHDAALVFWIDTLNEHWACVLRREGLPHWQRLPGSGGQRSWNRDDWHLTARLYEALKDMSVPAALRERLMQEVRQQRLEPLREYLRGKGSVPAVRRLFVVPTGRMARVPVEVLTPEYLVSYVSSGTLFARLMEQHRRPSGSSLLAVGDPVFEAPGRRLAEPPGHGLLVKFVSPGGNADRAGIRAGDVLLSYRDTTLHSLADLVPLLAQPGRASAIRWRNGESQTLTLEAGPLPITFDPRSARAAVRAWRRAEEPLTRGEPYRSLPGTRFEVETLRRLVGSGQSTCLLGSLASEQQLDRISRAGRLKQYSLLHFATHGHIDEDSPGRSALILSRDHLPDALEQARSGRKVQNGRLTVQTILSDWRLDADLVVLSACETALGKDAGGNGLLGFAHAFLARGARSVVLSRWKVDDTATALLMVRFYENLLGKRNDLSQPLPRAEALAEAKRWLRELPHQEAGRLTAELTGGVLGGTTRQRGKVVKLNPAGKKAVKLLVGERPFAHPFFWAAFVLVGDPD